MSEFGISMIYIFTGIVGAITTYLLSTKTNWGTVRSSAFLSLIVGIIFFKLDEHQEFLREVPLVFIGASFIGMTSSTKLRLWGIFFAGTLFGVLYALIPSVHIGAGGTMGTAACVSVLFVYGITSLISDVKTKKRGSIEPLD